MRFCLGLVCLNEAPWLRLHLPVMLATSGIDGLVAVDGGSQDDSIAVLESFGAAVESRPWDWHFGKQQNAVIGLAERCGYDAMLKYDPDELWFPAHLDQAIRLLADSAKAVVFPRINFEFDRWHYAPHANPRDFADWQLRAFRLGEGCHWRGDLHATTNAYDLWSHNGQIMRLIGAPIYHYEGIKPPAARALKWLNYERVRDGQPALDTLPAEYAVPTPPLRQYVPYFGAQPLDPAMCGAMAPVQWD